MLVRLNKKAEIAVWMLVMFLVPLVVIPSLTAQEMIWVISEGKALVEAGGTDQARINAIKNAEKRAVATALARDISIEALLVNLRLSGSITGSIPYGKVSAKKILEETQGPTGAGSDHQKMFYHVRMKAGVVRETGDEDPSFRIDAAINQSNFKDGDELEISIRTTKACYIAVFDILEDKKIIQLLPNYLRPKIFISPNDNFSFPSTQDRKKGLNLILHLPENTTSVKESIYILALPHPFDPTTLNAQEGFFGVYNGQTAFMKDLIREIASIPFENRAEALMEYQIRKNSKGIKAID